MAETAAVSSVSDRSGPSGTKLVNLTGAWCMLGYVALAVMARRPGEPDLGAFLLVVAWTGLPVFGLYRYLGSRAVPLAAGSLFLWALVFRICGLIGGPFFEDDFYRYLWDGYRYATAGSPYGAAPEDFFADPSVPALLRGVLDGIDYPELPTIYAPITELVFLLGYWLQPGSVAALQIILIVIDCATLALLLRLAPARNVLLYAWCPLVIKEIAYSAHPDGVGVCLLLAAMMLARSRRWRSAAVCLGLATGAKVLALVLVPLVLVGARTRHWMLWGLTTILLYAPFVLGGGTELESLSVFAKEWEFNSAVFGLLATVLERDEVTLLLGSLFVAFWVRYYITYVRGGSFALPRGDWLYGALLFVSPVINPWYLLWLLPFAAVFPSVWAWIASLAVLLSYVVGLNLNDYSLQAYEQPTWVRPLEFGMILLALTYDLFRRRRMRSDGEGPGESDAGAPETTA